MSHKRKTYREKANENSESIRELFQGIKRESPFSVPEGYFEKLPLTIADRIGKPKVNPLVSVMKRLSLKPGYAAGLAGIITIIVFLFFTVFNKSKNEIQIIPDITLTEVLQENPYFFDDVNEEDIIEIFLANSDDERDLFRNSDISDGEVIEYLSDEDMDNIDLLLNL
jgi:hypothetical protein